MKVGGEMYSMKEVCDKVGMTYQTLKYYCNEGLVPNVKRDENNYRIFDDNDLHWINNLVCLKNCNMSIKEMKEYMNLCLRGKETISKRKEVLNEKKKAIYKQIQELKTSIQYIDEKQELYDKFLDGSIPYQSYLIKNDD